MRPQIDNILLIETDGARQALLLMALLDAFPNAVVEPVASSEEALRTVATGRDVAASVLFDCVLMGDGVSDAGPQEMVRRLRASGVLCPVIVLSEREDGLHARGATAGDEAVGLPWNEALDGCGLRRRIESVVRETPDVVSRADRIKQRAIRTKRRAATDPVTGLADRGALRQFLNSAKKRRVAGAPWSFLTIDVDGLGETNRLHGFAAGDEALSLVAAHLRALGAGGDFVGRHRSDEFLVIKPGHDLGSAIRWSESLQDRLSGATLSASCGGRAVATSIGVVVAFDSLSVATSIYRSRQAALCAKRCSGSRIATWSMVQFERSTRASGSFERSLECFLDAWQGRMGATQSNHLTTHAEFVSSMAVRLGEALGLQSEDLQRLRRAGLCHDIGKFLVPERILSKSERLTEEERGLLSRHAPDGADMARLLGADRRTAEFVRHHHARFDDAFCADQVKTVPLGAHILCVADAFVTMTSHRPYKSTRTFADALRELERESGRQFAPAVVDALPKALLAQSRATSVPESC